MGSALSACATPSPPVEPEAPTLRKLTGAQLENSIRDLLGHDLYVPANLEPDLRAGGLLEVGASKAALSSRGAENLEEASYVLAEQAMDEEHRDELVPCSPASTVAPDCSAAFVTTFGRRAWRRPLTEDEVARISGIADVAAQTLGDFYDGLEFAIAALFQSPDFLYRTELGEADPSGVWDRRFSNWEVASRLSYLLWNTTPDDELLDAAERGELTSSWGLLQQLERMLTSSRSRDGLTNWYSDFLHLDQLDSLYKEPSVFRAMSDSLGSAARDESLLTFETLVLEEQGDMRDLTTTRRTFLNRELAALYDIKAPTREGFGEALLPDDRPRRGLLGQASFLALHAHPTSSSPTLRGKFLREVLLCQRIPGALAEVDTSIPPVSDDARTLRERVQRHLEDPACGGCHRPMDLPGLGLEHFDGLGGYRSMEEGVPVDASGELDGEVFEDASGLAQALREHEDLMPCVVQTLVRYATGLEEGDGQDEALDWLANRFSMDEYRLDSLVRDLVRSPLFLQAGVIELEGSEP